MWELIQQTVILTKSFTKACASTSFSSKVFCLSVAGAIYRKFLQRFSFLGDKRVHFDTFKCLKNIFQKCLLFYVLFTTNHYFLPFIYYLQKPRTIAPVQTSNQLRIVSRSMAFHQCVQRPINKSSVFFARSNVSVS